MPVRTHQAVCDLNQPQFTLPPLCPLCSLPSIQATSGWAHLALQASDQVPRLQRGPLDTHLRWPSPATSFLVSFKVLKTI